MSYISDRINKSKSGFSKIKKYSWSTFLYTLGENLKQPLET